MGMRSSKVASAFSGGQPEMENFERGIPMRLARARRSFFSLLAAILAFTSIGSGAAQADETADTSLLVVSLSNPRSTWNTFMALTDHYMSTIKKEGFTNDNYDELKFLENQISLCFDLTEVPPTLRHSRSVETAVCIREIAARFPPLPADYFPDLKAACEAIKSGHPAEWSYRDMPIGITLVEKGVYKGNYQFTLRTIVEAKATFEVVRHLPYIDKSAEGFWEAYFLTPGPMIPASWIKALPPIAQVDIYEQALWQWAVLLASYVVIFMAIYIVNKLAKRLMSGRSDKLRHIRWLPIPLTAIAAFFIQLELMEREVFITGEVLWCIRIVQGAVYLISAVVVVVILGNLLADMALTARRFQEKGIDAHLLKFAIHIASFALAIMILIQGLHRMGFSLSTLLAGAGITGLAIALAAQETLRNLIGSIMLLLDKPFHVGQTVKARGHEGVVEEMGLRSTKIRKANGHLVAIPNEDLARADIENIDERNFIQRHDRISIPSDTSPEKLEEALAIIRDALALKLDGAESRPNDPGHEPRVYIEKFEKGSLCIVFHYWFKPADHWLFMEHSHRVNQMIVQRFNKAGIKFA